MSPIVFFSDPVRGMLWLICDVHDLPRANPLGFLSFSTLCESGHLLYTFIADVVMFGHVAFMLTFAFLLLVKSNTS